MYQNFDLTPELRAKELIESFLETSITFPYIDTQDGQCVGSGYMTYRSAVRCAIVSVNHIINNASFHYEDWIEYWNNVKVVLEDLLNGRQKM